MPQITDIQVQKNHADRFSIYVDGKYAFPFSANDLLTWGLYKGQEVTEQELVNLQSGAGAAKAYDQVLNLLALRKRSQKEVRDYLKRKNYEPEAIDRTLRRLVDGGFLDDLEFAQSWIRDRNALKPRSSRKLEAELRAKGIDAGVISAALHEQDPEAELWAVQAVIKKKLTQYPDQRKLIEYLQRQGFSYSLIKRALEEMN
jgi:regulatory protein